MFLWGWVCYLRCDLHCIRNWDPEDHIKDIQTCFSSLMRGTGTRKGKMYWTMFAWQGLSLTMYWECPTCGANCEHTRLRKIDPCWLIKTWWNCSGGGGGRGYILAEKRGSSSKGKHSHSQSSHIKIDPKTGNGDSEPKGRIFSPLEAGFHKE